MCVCDLRQHDRLYIKRARANCQMRHGRYSNIQRRIPLCKEGDNIKDAFSKGQAESVNSPRGSE